MTTVNPAVAPVTQPISTPDTSDTSSSAIVASIANATSSQVDSFADQTFSALGQNGVQYLPFLTALANAFSSSGSSSGAGSGSGVASQGATAGATPADPPVNVGQATQQLLALRNADSGVSNIDSAISAIAGALPNLTQSQFSSLLATLSVAAQGGASGSSTPTAGASTGASPTSPAAAGAAGKTAATGPSGKIDDLDLSLLNSQINSYTTSNAAAGSSATGNAAFDAVLSAIKSAVANGSPNSQATQSQVAGILSDITSALLPPSQAASVNANLQSALNGTGTLGLSAAPTSASTPSGAPSYASQATQSGANPLMTSSGVSVQSTSATPARSVPSYDTYDPMTAAYTDLLNSYAAAGGANNPNSTAAMVLSMFSNALSGNTLTSGQGLAQAYGNVATANAGVALPNASNGLTALGSSSQGSQQVSAIDMS